MIPRERIRLCQIPFFELVTKIISNGEEAACTPVTLLSFGCLIHYLVMSKPLDIGESAPRLTVTIDTGEQIELGREYNKSIVLVYFYPKSDTPGCTKQACNIRDAYKELQEKQVTIFGASIDSVKSQAKFKKKYQLPFSLIADAKKELGKAFGVGTLLGLCFQRQSFLIKGGKIIWRDLSASPTTQTEDALKGLMEA